MFKQRSNQSGSGGRLVIPKNSKWSLAAGICMIAALLFMLFFKPLLYFGVTNASFRFNMPPLNYFFMLLFAQSSLIEILLFILFFVGGFIVFIITALRLQKNIKRYIFPLVMFIISVALPYFSSPQSGFQSGVWMEFLFASKLAVFWGYIPFLIAFLLLGTGKVSKHIATIIGSCGIGYIWLMVLINLIDVPSALVTMFVLVAINHTLILMAFLIVLFNFKKLTIICSKCGTEITGKVKYCNICGESTGSAIIK